MGISDEQIVIDIVAALEKAWNDADGDGFGRPFADDADFVNIRGEHFQTRGAIAKGRQTIFDTIYKGSVVTCEVSAQRAVAPGIRLVHVRTRLTVPTGPLAGEQRSLFSALLVQDQEHWRIAAFHNTLVASAPPGGSRGAR